MISIEEIKEIFQEAEVANIDNISNETQIFLELNIDSLTIIEIMCAIENKYGIEFKEENMDFIEEFTVGDFRDMINRELNGSI